MENTELECKLTVCMSVDSAFATSTKTSASRQWRSIQESMSGERSMPGLRGTTEVGHTQKGRTSHRSVLLQFMNFNGAKIVEKTELSE